jgi:hypothetical protein
MLNCWFLNYQLNSSGEMSTLWLGKQWWLRCVHILRLQVCEYWTVVLHHYILFYFIFLPSIFNKSITLIVFAYVFHQRKSYKLPGTRVLGGVSANLTIFFHITNTELGIDFVFMLIISVSERVSLSRNGLQINTRNVRKSERMMELNLSWIYYNSRECHLRMGGM